MKTLILSLFLFASSICHANDTVVYCEGGIEFIVPTFKGSRVNLQFELSTTVTTLEFNSKNLLLIATDQIEPTRIRLTISAVSIGLTEEGDPLYRGQIMADLGDTQHQITSGPIDCVAVIH